MIGLWFNVQSYFFSVIFSLFWPTRFKLSDNLERPQKEKESILSGREHDEKPLRFVLIFLIQGFNLESERLLLFKGKGMEMKKSQCPLLLSVKGIDNGLWMRQMLPSVTQHMGLKRLTSDHWLSITESVPKEKKCPRWYLCDHNSEEEKRRIFKHLHGLWKPAPHPSIGDTCTGYPSRRA